MFVWEKLARTRQAIKSGDSLVHAVVEVVEAENLDAAVAITESCPALAEGGGLEVGTAVEFDAGAAPAGGAA